MTAPAAERAGTDPWAGSSLLEGQAPAGVIADARLTTARLGGRRVLLAELGAADAATAVRVAAVAEARGSSAILLASAPLGGLCSPAALRGAHVLVGPEPAPATGALLAAAGLLPVVVGPGALPVLAADDEATAVDLAALLLGYLPAPGGSLPHYAPTERPESHELEPAHRRNALVALHRLVDDALRVLPAEDDAHVLALARVEGRTIAVVAPQRLAAESSDEASLARLVALVRLAARLRLPLLVLGAPQRLTGTPTALAALLRDLAIAVAELAGPVLIVVDDAPASAVSSILAAAPAVVRLDPAAGLRASIAAWLD